MRRESYRERALVIRTYDFGEADRIIVLLTRGRGLVRGVAKGVRRAKSRFGSRLQPFVELDVQLYPGRNLESITQADTVQFFGAEIIDDFQRYAAACSVLEAAERLAFADHDEDTYLYDAVLSALDRIRTYSPPTVPLDAFLLQAMEHAGWAPSLFDCAQCGAPGPHAAFHPGAGGAVCPNCRPPGSPTPPTEVLRLMWWMANDQRAAIDGWRDIEGAIATTGEVFADLASAAHRLTRAHLQWHLERSVSSMNFVDEGWT